jgi:two-component system NarL family response regulator
MRVLLADDHGLLVEGLQNLLEAHGIEVAGIARNGQEAIAQARIIRPDVILMDVRMPVMDGLAATRVIKTELPETKVVILTTSSEDEDLFEAVKSGASGYLLKNMDAEDLVEALHDAQIDTPPFAPGLAARLLAEFARGAQTAKTGEGILSDSPAGGSLPGAAATAEPSAKERLTPRQIEILTLVAQGLSYKEVGRKVSLSPRTIKYHMAEAMRKLHMQNRSQVLAYVGRMTTGDQGKK